MMENQSNFKSPPDNYLVWAVLSTILCCLPLGIVSIIESSKVNERWARGDYEGAKRASESAKKFAIWSAVASLVVYILIILFYLGVFAFIYTKMPPSYDH